MGRVLKDANIPFSLAVLGVGIEHSNLNLNATGSKVCCKTTFTKVPGTITANLADRLTCLQLQTCLNSKIMVKDLILLAQKGSGAPIGVVAKNNNEGISLLRREGQEGSTVVFTGQVRSGHLPKLAVTATGQMTADSKKP